MTNRSRRHQAAAGLLALFSVLLVAGCGVTDPFASSAPDGKVVTFDIARGQVLIANPG
ncbi:MAG: hypothetical protein ACOYD0_09730 [Candidatus Nanopelagicales bacterium]